MAHEDMLTEEQSMMRGMVRDFCQSEVAPLAAETDAGRFPRELAEKMARLGLLGMTAPAEYGGGGADEVSVALVMEEISAVCPSLSVFFAVQNSLVCAPLSRYGSEAQKNETLRALARGKKLGCFALSEPSAGSDAVALQTRARRAGDGWRIEGDKRFISNAREADLCLIFAAVFLQVVHEVANGRRHIVPQLAVGLQLARVSVETAVLGVEDPGSQIGKHYLRDALEAVGDGAVRILDAG